MRTTGHMTARKRLVVSVGVAALAVALLAPMASAAAPKTKLVSQSSSGDQADGLSFSPDLSASGRFVVFSSEADDLVPGDDNNTTDVFIRDMKTGKTELVSVAIGGGVGDFVSFDPTVSADGRYVVFTSGATDLIAAGTSGARHIYVRDRLKNKTELISRSSAGSQGNANSSSSSISASGRWVAFQSKADNLVAEDTNGKVQIYLYDRDNGKVILVSRNNAGAAGKGKSKHPAISANGRYITYWSFSSNLTGQSTRGKGQVFLFDRITKKTELISRNKKGKSGNGSSRSPAISANGTRVIFESDATNLGKDTNGRPDVYLRDRSARTTKLVSLNWKGKQLTGGSFQYPRWPDIAANGRWVAFTSTATNARKGITFSGDHGLVYARNLVTGKVKLISRSAKRANGFSWQPSLSRDGAFVAFTSRGTNLISGDANGTFDVFRRGPTY